MSDHIFDPHIVKDLRQEGVEEGEIKLGVDKRINNNPLVDIDDVTKVLVENNRILDIGKTIPNITPLIPGYSCARRPCFLPWKRVLPTEIFSLSGGIRKLALKTKGPRFRYRQPLLDRHR